MSTPVKTIRGVRSAPPVTKKKTPPQTQESGWATWSPLPNPLRWLECPHCKKTILLGKAPIMDRLIQWAKNVKNF